MPVLKVLLFDGDGIEPTQQTINQFGIKYQNIEFLGNSQERQDYFKTTKRKPNKIDNTTDTAITHSTRVIEQVRRQVPKNVRIKFVVAAAIGPLIHSRNSIKETDAYFKYFSSTMKRAKPDIVLSTTGASNEGALKDNKFLLSISEAIGKAAIDNKLMFVSAIGNSGTENNQYEHSDNTIKVLSTRPFSSFPKKGNKGYITIKEEGSLSKEREEFKKKLLGWGYSEEDIKEKVGVEPSFGTSFGAPQVVGLILKALVTSPVNIGTLKQRRVALHTVLSIIRDTYISKNNNILPKDKNKNVIREDQTEKLVGDLDKIIKNNATLIRIEQNKPEPKEPKETSKLFFDNNNINLNGLLGGK